MPRFIQRRAYWGVFDSSGAEVASYPFKDKAFAESVVEEMNEMVKGEVRMHKSVSLIPSRSFHLRLQKEELNDFVEVS